MICLVLLLSLFTAPCLPGDAALLVPSQETAGVPARPPTEIRMGAGLESLTGNRSTWTRVFARVQAGVGPGIGVHGEAVRTDRFDLVDSQLRLGVSGRSGGGWSGDVEVATSPTSRVLPSLSLVANVHREVGGGVVLGLGGRHHEYDLGDVRVGSLMADYYAGDFRVGYTLSTGFVGGESAAAHVVSASRYYGTGSGVTLVAGAGQSVERIDPQTLLITDIASLALWGVHWTSPRLGLTYGASFHRQGDLFDRRAGEIGLRIRP